MTLYTLIRNIETENPEYRAMIDKRISLEVLFIKVGEGRIDFIYSSEEEAAKDAELWNKRVEGANLVPAKVTRSGEIKYRSSKFWREMVQEIKRVPTYEELGYMYSVVFGSLGGGIALKAGLEQLLNKIDPNFSPEQELIFAGVLGLTSLGCYWLGRNCREVAPKAIETSIN